MRIAIVTANVGGIDIGAEERFEKLNIADLYYYDEYNLPFPLPNLNDRLKSKYIKIMTHRFLPQYDVYIWVDSSVELVDVKGFIPHILKGIKMGCDLQITPHHERFNAYDELDFIKEQILLGKEYLSKRYENEPLEEEKAFYQQEGLERDFPLYITRFFARPNNEKVNKAFDDWWLRVLEFANFDQSMLSHIVHKHKLQVAVTDYQSTVEKFLRIHKHL